MSRKKGGDEPTSESPTGGEPAAETPLAPDQPAAASGTNEERLPWLERIEEDEPRGRGSGGALGYALGFLVLLALVVGGVFLLQPGPSPRDNGMGDEDLAGLTADNNVLGPSNGASATSAAASGKTSGKPKRDPAAARPPKPKAAPVTPGRRDSAVAAAAQKPQAAAAKQVARAPAADPKPSAPRAERQQSTARARPVGPVQVLQLGAYGSRAAAERAWKQASADRRFAGASHSVERATVRGRTVHRLRVEVPASKGGCRSLGLSSRGCFEVRGPA